MAFRKAWAYYFALLMAIYIVFAILVDLVIRGPQGVHPIAGLVYEYFVQPSLQQVAEMAGKTTGVGLDISSNTFTNVVPVPEDVTKPKLQPAPSPAVVPLRELPLVLSLMAVGILPSIPYVSRVESWIRKRSLHWAGIPLDVVEMWQRLRLTPFLDHSDETVPDANLTFLEKEQHNLISAARKSAQRLVGEAEFEKNRSALALVFSFDAWTRQDPKWPEQEIVDLYSRGRLRDLHDDISGIQEDLRHFDELSELSELFACKGTSSLSSPGFHEFSKNFELHQEEAAGDTEQEEQDALQKFDALLSHRWTELMKRVAESAEQITAMLALYVERVDVIPDETYASGVTGR